MAQERLRKMLRDVMRRDEFRAFFKRAGRRGGKIGGKLAAERMTAEQRRARASKAAKVRWRKHRKAKRAQAQ